MPRLMCDMCGELHCMDALCGRSTPAACHAIFVTPEQSYPGPSPAHTYGAPRMLYANFTATPAAPGAYGAGGLGVVAVDVGLPYACVRMAYRFFRSPSIFVFWAARSVCWAVSWASRSSSCFLRVSYCALVCVYPSVCFCWLRAIWLSELSSSISVVGEPLDSRAVTVLTPPPLYALAAIVFTVADADSRLSSSGPIWVCNWSA